MPGQLVDMCVDPVLPSWRSTNAITAEGSGSSWAIPARRTAARAGTTPYTVEEARAERFDTPDLAEKRCLDSQLCVSNRALR